MKKTKHDLLANTRLQMVELIKEAAKIGFVTYEGDVISLVGGEVVVCKGVLGKAFPHGAALDGLAYRHLAVLAECAAHELTRTPEDSESERIYNLRKTSCESAQYMRALLPAGSIIWNEGPWRPCGPVLWAKDVTIELSGTGEVQLATIYTTFAPLSGTILSGQIRLKTDLLIGSYTA